GGGAMGGGGPAAYARAHRDRFVAELARLVRFPSVSAQPARAGDVRACAGWLAEHLAGIGLRGVPIAPTPPHPLLSPHRPPPPRPPTVSAGWRGAPAPPPPLVSGHSAGPPAEPLAAWTSPPFAPAVRGGYLHGRGAADDKGQLFAHVKALEACLQTAGRL